MIIITLLGTLLAIEQDGVRPDLVIMGKAISGGCYPVSVVLGDDDIMSVLDLGSHGSTFGGNPLACAISMAALKVLVDEDLPGKAERLGKILFEGLKKIQNPLITQVIGRGLMVGVILDQEALKGRNAWDLCLLLKTRGILMRSAGPWSLRLLPPLVISEAQILEAVSVLDQALRELPTLKHIPGTELKSENNYSPTSL